MGNKRVSAFANAGSKVNRATKKPKENGRATLRDYEKNQGGNLGALKYVAGRAGIDFLRVGEGVLDAAAAPFDLIRGDVDMAKSRFLDSPVDDMREKLEREYNPGKVAGFIGDIAGGIGQSVGYGLISAIPYAGTPMMYSSIVEQSISSAAEKTGEVGWKEVGYGATAGAVEGLLESKLGAGVKAAKGIGSAILKKTGVNLTKSAAKAGGKTMLKSVLTDTAKGFAGEFAQEAIPEAIDPLLLRRFGIDENAKGSIGDVFYAGLIGGLSGGIMSAVPAAINYRSAVSAGRAIQESRKDGDLIKRAKYTLSALEAAQTRAEGQKKGKPEGDTKETAKEWLSRTAENRKVKRMSKETAQLADKIRRNIQAYENSMKDPAMAQSEPVAALLGELRGNLFLVGYAYEADVIEQVMMDATDEQRQAFVDAINEVLDDQGKKHDYTLADFDANKDDIRRGLAGLLMMDELMGNTAEGVTEYGAKATEKPVEPAQATKDTTAEQVTDKEENAATEATEAAETDPWESIEGIEGFGTQNAQEEALLRAASSQGVPKRTVPAMLKSYREGTDLTPAEFAEAWGDGVMFFGRLGLNESAIKKDSTLDRIGENARRASIQEGKTIADEELKRAKEKADKKKMPARNQADAKRKQEGRGAVVKGKGLIVRDLDTAQYAAYKAAETFAAVLGTDIVIETDLKTDTGKQINGFYSQKTNGIHININAKRNGKSIALYTLGHEVTHYIKEWSPEKFKALSDFVLNQLGDKAPDLIAAKAEFLRKVPDYKDYTVTQLNDLAVEEVVADSMELVLSDGKIMDEMARTEKTVWQKIKDFITKIIADIRKYYGELNQASKTAQVLKETVDSLDEIEQLFYEGVTEAGERTRTAGVGKAVQREGEVVYSYNGQYNFTDSQQFKNWFGDWEKHPNTASKVVNTDGTPKILYHQTSEDFTVFDPKHTGAGTTDFETPFGIFMKPTDSDIGLKGQKQMALYANIRKTLEANDRADLVEKLKSLSPKYADLLNEMQSMNEEYKSKVDDAFNAWTPFVEEYRKTHPQVSRREILLDAEAKKVYDEPKRLTEEWTKKSDALAVKCKEEINKTLKDNGYDGVHIREDAGSGGRNTETYIALDPEQVKSATENIGTFDGTNPDIRYSIDEDSDTAYLAAVESGDMETAQKMVEDTLMSPWDIEPINRITSKKMFDYLVSEFESNGYNGRPIVVLDGQAITGSHRILAAREAGIDIPVVKISVDVGNPLYEELLNAGDDSQRANVAKELYDDGTINKEAYDLITREDELNEENWGREPEDAIRYSIEEDTDTAYLAAVERGDMETAQKKVDEAAKAAGYINLFYHGAKKGGGFTVFRDWSYFTENKAYADRYTDREKPSSLYKTYVKMDKPFDTRKTKDRRLFAQIRDEYGLGEIQDTGLPDWTDGYDISDYIDENDLDYDGIILDEGGDLVDGVPISRGLSYVVRKSAQIKSADPVTYDDNGNVIPLSERFKEDNSDIRYSIDDTPETPDVSDSAATDRDLLLAMAEKLVGSEEENRILTNYKSHYDTQKARQAKLDELTAEMREQQSIMMYDQSAEKRSAAAKSLPAIYKEMSKISEQLADADRKLTEIEGMKAIRNLLKREYAKAREIQKNIYDTRAKVKREAAETTELRRKTRRIYNRVLRLLVSPNRKRNIPYEMQGIAAEALKTANMDIEAMERLEKLEQELTALEREAVPNPEKIAQKEEQIEAQEKKVGKTKDHLQVMIEIFEKAKDIKEGVGRSVYDESALAKLKDLQSKIGNTTIGKMNREQLQALKDFYDILYTRISNANKMLSEEREATVEEYGSKATTEASDAKYLKFLSPKSMELKGMANVRQFFWKNMKPLTVFEAIGSDTFTRLFQSVLNGENVWARDIEEARKKIVETRDKYGYDKWELDKRIDVKDKDGKTVRLSLSEMMSLYAYAKRKQAMGHLEGGGFVLDPDATEMAKGKVISFADMERRLNHAERHVVDQMIIGEIASKLTAEQKSYVDEMQTYLTKLGERGNTVSRKLYGIDIFTEEYYFPIKVKSEYLESHTGRTGDPNIKNRGMTKEVTPEADNPLVLQGFDAVMVDHINSMATYHAFVLPVEDLTRVLNYKPSNAKIDEDGNWTVDESRKDYSTLKAVIEEKYGAEANHYIEQLIRDLNGGARRDAAATLLDKGITGFKRASTMASLSVLFQQPTSLIRAAAYIDPKYLFGQASIVDFANHKKLWERLCKYAPVGIIKEMGGYDTGVGARTGDYLNAKNYKTPQEKLEAFFKTERFGGDSNYRAEVFGKGAAYADEMAWIQMFEACVNEQADKLGKSRDSEEVLKAAGKRFEEVVRRTQVYDSTLTRTEFMRSKDTGMKMATAFMAEPSTVVSMVADAIMKAERGDTAFLRRTAGAVAGAVIINALASSLVYAMRDDDEEKTYGEKYVASVSMEAAEAVNPLEYLPYFRDIMSIMKGYEIERTDMTLISNLFQQVELLTNSKRTVGDKVLGVSGAVSAFFGIPMTNLTRDAKGIVNTFMGGVDTERGTAKGMSAALKEEFSGIFGLFDEQTKNEYQLYQAYVSGDTAHYDRVKARYKSESAAEQALRKALRDHEPRISEAAEARLSGDLAVYESIVDQIESEGIFDRNIVIRAINNEMLDLKDEDNSKLVPKDETVTEEEEETAESLYKSSDLNAALERGDTDDFAAIMAAMVQDKVDAGKTEAQAKSSVKSAITAYWKKQYLSGYQDTETRKRIIAILTETGLYGSRNDVATMCEGWVRASK